MYDMPVNKLKCLLKTVLGKESLCKREKLTQMLIGMALLMRTHNLHSCGAI